MRPRAVVIVVGAAAAVVFGVAVGVGVAAVGEAVRPVWIVSGVDEAYSVDVDNEHVVVQPFGRRVVEIGVGQHELRVHRLSGETRVVVVDDEVAFWRAPFDLAKNAHLINPDGAAVVVVDGAAHDLALVHIVATDTAFVIAAHDDAFAAAVDAAAVAAARRAWGDDTRPR